MTEDQAGTPRPSPSGQWLFGDGHDAGWRQPPENAVSRLRPYLLTSGRAQPVDDSIEIEAQIRTTELGVASRGTLAFEQRDIVSLCMTNMSIAEVAAKLNLHIGVARVLAADLAAMGYVAIKRPNVRLSHDPDLIERVIRGLEAIR
jgi:hypothetical protein